MANTIIQCTAPDALSLYLRLYEVNGNTLINTSPSGDILVERTNNKGQYTTTVTENLVGIKEVRVVTSGDLTVASYVTEPLINDTATYKCHDVIMTSISAVSSFPIVERSPNDTNPITFVWPVTSATISGDVSLDNAAYTTTAGSLAFLRTDGSRHLYTLSHNTADRPVAEGTARYQLTDGTYTKYLNLRVEGASTDSSGIRDAIGMGEANLDIQLRAISGDIASHIDTGDGARTVHVLVNDGTSPLENASVRLTEGANTFILETSVAGSGTFNLDDATYDVALTKVGYTFSGTTLVVTGSTSKTYSMSATIITPPPNATTSTGLVHLYDHMGVLEVGATASVQITSGPGGSGIGYDRKIWKEISNSAGLVQFSGLIREATYDYWRGSSKTEKVSIVVPDALSFNLDEIIGAS